MQDDSVRVIEEHKMCCDIHAKNLLLNYFSRSDATQISVREMKELKNRVLEQLKGAYIDISRDALLGAEQAFPFFSKRGKIIGCERTGSFEEFTPEYVNETFNWRLSENYQKKYIKCIDDFISKKGD